jgi:hypothetical protein
MTECFTNELYDLLDETFEQVQGIYLDRGTSIRHNLSASEQYQLNPISLDYSVNLRYSQGHE